MTTEELRAAAERLVEWADDPDPEADMFYNHISEAEAVALARVYLAEHPEATPPMHPTPMP